MTVYKLTKVPQTASTRPLITPEHSLSPFLNDDHKTKPSEDDRPIIIFPPSFEGWLSAVFFVYKTRLHNHAHLRLVDTTHYVPALLDNAQHVSVNEHHAGRVLSKLHQLLGKSGMRQLLWGFLSEQQEIGSVLFRVVKYALTYPDRRVLQDLGHLDVLTLAQTVKSVGREKHRMEAFVRFEHTRDDIYFARVSPDFNVLPLIGEHFRQRYQDQNWAIYDVQRDFGIYYDMSLSTPKHPAPLQTIDQIDETVLRQPSSIHSENEQRYQRFWQGYFANVNISERKNTRLHRQYLPQRYWQYLSEKQVAPDASHLTKKR